MDQAVRISSSTNATASTGQGIVVASCTVEDLLCGNAINTTDGTHIQGQLHIPEYQRPYTWGVTQINRLLDDLDEYNKNESVTHLYYMGSIILHQDENGALNIVDGQQRLTTLALLGYVNGAIEPSIQYSAPSSQQQIAINLYHLRQLAEQGKLPQLDAAQMNITLVVTSELDDAYRFFETQNTGGVSLTGPQVIKAIHLRAVEDFLRDDLARKWESWSDLDEVVSLLMQVRYWNILQPRIYPLHNQRQKIKKVIVNELSEQCGKGGDIHYRMVSDAPRGKSSTENTLYSLRQPLNKGENAIGYLDYFACLYQSYFIDAQGGETFNTLYDSIVSHKDSSPYLKTLYQAATIAYVSRFGDGRLLEASLWIFRMIYSVRVKNVRTVNERSARAFARDAHIFDKILVSYTHEELLGRLESHSDNFNKDNLDREKTKGRFIRRVIFFFSGKPYKDITIEEIVEFTTDYDQNIRLGIRGKLGMHDA